MSTLVQSIEELINHYTKCQKESEAISDLRDSNYHEGIVVGLKMALTHIEKEKPNA